MNKPLSYYLDNFATIAKDQGASRYLQDLLNNYSETEINYFFEPLCKNILQIIDDPFANYLMFFRPRSIIKIIENNSPFIFSNKLRSSWYSSAPKINRIIKKSRN